MVSGQGEEWQMKNKGIKLTRFELEIMDPLWKMGRASVREIQECLPEKKRPAYTTIQTIVRRLEEKGAVKQVRKIGNAHIFEPSVTRDSVHRRLVSEFLDLFGGSARPIMAHIAGEGKLSLEDVRELESLLQNENKDE